MDQGFKLSLLDFSIKGIYEKKASVKNIKKDGCQFSIGSCI